MENTASVDNGRLSRPFVRRWLAPPAVAVVVTVIGVWALSARYGSAPLRGPVGDGAWTARSRAWFTPKDFHPPELDKDSGRQFIWTRRRSSVVIPFLDRATAYRVSFKIIAGRPTGVPFPDLSLVVDGIVTHVAVDNAPRVVDVLVPASRTTAATIELAVSDVFVPGPQDRRELGVMVDEIAIAPIDASHLPVPWSSLAAIAAAAAIYALIGVFCGVPLAMSLVVVTVVSLAHAWLVTYDAAFLGRYAWRALPIAGGTMVAGLAVALIRRLWPPRVFPEWPAVAAVLLQAIGTKLAFFAHPAATVGDSIFQVHRAQMVAAGQYFFTSITPRPFFEFPYAIGLYVAAMPFWNLFTTEPGHVMLLRILALVADASVALPLYFLVRRFWKSQSTALVAAGLYPLLRVSLRALCTSNLTNVFGQGMFGLAMAFLIWQAERRRPVVAIVGGGLAVAAAFLSHFSTMAVGIPVVAAVAASLAVGGEPGRRRASLGVAGALLVGATLSYVTYYSHFHPVYQKTFARVVAREGEAPRRSMVAPPSIKASRAVFELRESYGDLVLAAAAAGALILLRRRRRDPLTLSVVGWAVTVGALWVLGILTPVELRTLLAAAPVVACLAATGIAALLDARPRVVVLSGFIVLAGIVADGLLDWVSCLAGLRCP